MSFLVAKIVRMCCKTAAYLNGSDQTAVPEAVPAE
jgi:hypothetical protein